MTNVLSFNNANQTHTRGSSPHIFDFQSHKVRVVMDEWGNPWFVVKDVCQVLGHTNATMAIGGLDDDEKGLRKVSSFGGTQETNVVNESGLYTLIMRSHKSNAKIFRKWVTSEVLFSIRKTGGYRAPENDLPPPDFSKLPETYAQLMSNHRYVVGACEHLEKKNETLTQMNQQLKPKAEFHDRYRNLKGLHCLRSLGKIFNFPPHSFIQHLIDDGLLYRNGKNILPNQIFVNKGWFQTKLFCMPWGASGHYAVVTAKGVQAIAELYGFSSPTE